MSKWILSLASVAMLALAMSGCGGSDGSSSVGGADGGTTAVTPPAESSTTQARDLSGTPDQFGDALPAVPMPDLAE